MKPLEDIKIIDLTRLLPGPVATHLLGQMGAEVIKIESPNRMDYARFMGKQVDGASILFHQLNHNKQFKLIDYTTPDGKAALLDLIKDADALIEQFRPRAMEAWGLGYEAIKAINPNIVYVSLTGYGQQGNYKNEAGHDFNYLAYAGMMSFLKDDHGKPVVPDFQLADIAGAYMAVMALQAALIKKLKTGAGSYVDVAMCDAVMPFLAIPYSLHCSEMDCRIFNVINGRTTVNYAAYECADGKWLSIAALEIKFWNNLCDVIGKPEWKRQHQMELMNANFVKQDVADFFKTKTRDAWMEILQGKDVCAAPILEIEELEDFGYHREKNTFLTFETENGSKLKTMNLPFRIS